MKFTLLGIFLLSGSLFASEMCVSLCKPCAENPADSTCARIDSQCHCAAVIDSVQKQELLAAQIKSSATEKLAQNIQDSCKKSFCAFQIAFSGDSLKTFQRTKIPVSKKRLKFYKLDKADSVAAKDTSNIQPIALSGECKNFCAFCPAEKSADSNCIRIENLCGCAAFAEREFQIAEKAKADSVQKIEKFIKRKELLKLAADSIYAHYTNAKEASFTVTIRKEDFFIVDIRKSETKIEEPSNAIISIPQDSSKNLSDSLKINPKQNAEITTKDKPAQISGEAEKQWRVFYPGISLQIGHIRDNGIAGNDVSQDFGIFTGLGVSLRAYFYKYGSFQTGINAVYQYANYAFIHLGDYYDRFFNGGIEYHSVSAEIPLEFRFGFPLWKGLCPFASYNFNIRKPIYAWYNWYIASESHYYRTDGDEWNSSQYKSSDFDFMGYFGIGLEVYRHISLEFQWLLHSISTYADDTTTPYDKGDTWRIKIDIAF